MDQIFVFVHRWFRRGEGWAYHPDMECRVRDIAHVVASRVLHGGHGRFEVLLEQGMIFGEIVPDTDCQNATAIARGASIAKVALLPAVPLFQKNVDRLYRALQAVQTPNAEGPNGKLVIKYRDASAPVPSSPQGRSAGSTELPDEPTQQSKATGGLRADRPGDAPDDQTATDTPNAARESALPDKPPDARSRHIMAVLGIVGVVQLIVLYASFIYNDLLLFLCSIVTLGCLAWMCSMLRCRSLPTQRWPP